jgi:large subunit ribosomal protein L7Ae
VAPAPLATKSKDSKKAESSLFEKRPRNFSVGNDIQPKRDLTRYVKWPQYVRLQRQRAILKKRLKVPPSINQFSRTLDKNTATQVFRLLAKYQPESKVEKKLRLKATAAAKVEGKTLETKKPINVKYGLNHITALIENKKAQLVLIAHDVEPIELVVWMPALCRKMGVPYAIVKGKSRLGALVHKKTASCVAITEVRSENKQDLAALVQAIKANYNDKAEEIRKQWGGGIMGAKSQAMMAKRAAAHAKNAELRQ